MAESRESSTFDQRRAVSLLQEATRFLQEYSSQGDRTSPTGVSSNAQQPAEVAPSTSRAEPSTSRALQNFRSIFAPYAQRLSPGACSSRQTSEKRPKKGKWSNFSFKRETFSFGGNYNCHNYCQRLVPSPTRFVSKSSTLSAMPNLTLSLHNSTSGYQH